MRLWSLAPIALFVVGCGNGGGPSPTGAPNDKQGTATLKKLGIVDTKVGKGPTTAKVGDKIWVWYSGKLTDGTIFDSKLQPDSPFSTPLEQGALIQGWIDGIPGMRVGGERKLSIPASLAYGPAGSGDKVPPNSDLYFDIKLAYVVHPGEEKVFDPTDTKIGTGPEAKKGSKVSITYTAYLLTDEKVIDMTKPDTFTIGKGEVLQGLEYGVIGMKQGGKRTLMLPPDAAFGPVGSPPKIPGDTPLRFEVVLVEVK